MSSSIYGNNPLSYMGVKPLNPPEIYFRTRMPNNAIDFQQYNPGDIWIDSVGLRSYQLMRKTNTSATWAGFAGLADVDSLTGNAGGVIGPDVLQNINIVGVPGTNGINVTGNPATWTLTVAMNSPLLGDFDFRNTAAATPRVVSVTNTDADPGSSANFHAQSASPGGDAFILFGAGALYYSFGIDTSDTRRLKLTSGATPSAGTTYLMLDTVASTLNLYPSNILQTRALVAGGVNTIIQNTDNTNIASDAFLRLDVGGAAAGDPFINFIVTGAGNTISIGMDNTDSDYFKITDGASPSNGNIFAQLAPATFTWTYPVYNVLQQITNIGQPVWHNVYNQDNTNGSSEAYYRATVGGAAGGDPYIAFNVTGVGFYAVGIDNSDSDNFKINYGANPSVGTQLFVMTTAGVITLANDLDVSEGGTGRSAHTIHGVLIGNAGGDINATTAGVAGQHLVSSGPLADPTWSAVAYPVVCAIGDVLYGSALNTYSNLTFVATATRYLANTGGGATIPAWAQVDLTNGVTGTLPVTNGGLGVASPTDHSVLVGSGATAVTPIAVGNTGELLVGATGADPAFGTSANGDFTFTSATAAGDRTLTIINTDNTAVASQAHLQVSVGGATSTGDPYVNFLVTGAGTYSIGIDNTDSDLLKITSGANPSAGSTLMTIAGSGNVYVNTGDLYTQRSFAGGIVETIVSNSDNTNAASSAGFFSSVGGTSAGDPYVNFLVSGAGIYSVGIDNSDSDKFKITASSTPSAGTDLFTMTNAGVITLANDLDVTEGGTGVSTLTSHGLLLGNGAGDVQALAEAVNGAIPIGSTGANPVLATLSAGVGVAISNGAGTITISAAGGGMAWSAPAVDAAITVNNGYIANKAGLLTMTLPATAVLGDTIRITGINTAVGWRIAQNANQQIHFGNLSTTAGVGGYLEATAIRDSVELVCVVAGGSTEYNVISSVGNITIV